MLSYRCTAQFTSLCLHCVRPEACKCMLQHKNRKNFYCCITSCCDTHPNHFICTSGRNTTQAKRCELGLIHYVCSIISNRTKHFTEAYDLHVRLCWKHHMQAWAQHKKAATNSEPDFNKTIFDRPRCHLLNITMQLELHANNEHSQISSKDGQDQLQTWPSQLQTWLIAQYGSSQMFLTVTYALVETIKNAPKI